MRPSDPADCPWAPNQKAPAVSTRQAAASATLRRLKRRSRRHDHRRRATPNRRESRGARRRDREPIGIAALASFRGSVGTEALDARREPVAGLRQTRRSSRRIAARVSGAVAPSNASSPGQHLVQHAAEREDVGTLIAGSPFACSGDMYATVPRTIPGSVSPGRLRPAAVRLVRNGSCWQDRSPEPSCVLRASRRYWLASGHDARRLCRAQMQAHRRLMRRFRVPASREGHQP